MLPFLKKDRAPGLIIEQRKPDEDKQSEQDQGLKAVAQELIDAIHNKDVNAVARILQEAHEIVDTFEHEEGPHTNEE